MWLVTWTLYIIVGVVGFYALVVLPLVLLYSAVFPQTCLTCKRRTLKYLKFVSTDPGLQQAEPFVPRAYYRCRQCHGAFKLERGDWSSVAEAEVEKVVQQRSRSTTDES